MAGVNAVGFLDEAGFSLSLPTSYTWCRVGEEKEVPKSWGSRGRVNVVGHWVWDGQKEQLFYCLVRGSVRGEVVRAYLERVVEGLTKRLRLFWDHAPFHRGQEVRERREGWRRQGLEIGYLPRYSPHLNPMETIWRRVKGFLLPRRYYRNLEELEHAVRLALKALGGIELKFQGEDTYLRDRCPRQDPALPHDLSHERIPTNQPGPKLVRSHRQQRDAPPIPLLNGSPCLLQPLQHFRYLPLICHHHQEVHVAVRPRIPPGKAPVQDHRHRLRAGRLHHLLPEPFHPQGFRSQRGQKNLLDDVGARLEPVQVGTARPAADQYARLHQPAQRLRRPPRRNPGLPAQGPACPGTARDQQGSHQPKRRSRRNRIKQTG